MNFFEDNSMATAALLIFILKELYHWFKDSSKHHDELLQQNTIAIHRLTVKLEFLEKRLESLPGIEKDLAGLGAKVRSLSKEN